MKKSFFFLTAMSFCNISFEQSKSLTHYHSYHKKKSTETSDTRYGVASYYAQKFNGRRTACGEIFSSAKYTGACNVLRLRTWVRVTNLRNNKSVIVKVNDRLCRENKRLIDLSRSAAKELGYYGRGITRVKLDVLPDYHPI